MSRNRLTILERINNLLCLIGFKQFNSTHKHYLDLTAFSQKLKYNQCVCMFCDVTINFKVRLIKTRNKDNLVIYEFYCHADLSICELNQCLKTN